MKDKVVPPMGKLLNRSATPPGQMRGIGTSVIRLCLSLFLAVASLLTVGEALIVASEVRRDREARIGSLASANLPALEQALWNLDSPIIELILRGLVANPAVERVELLDPAGSILYRFDAPGGHRPAASGSDLGAAHSFDLSYSRPGKRDAPLGLLVIYPSLFAEHQQFRATIALGLGAVIVLVVFLSAILAFAVERDIGRPVRDFASQVAGIDTADPGSAELRVPLRARGELAYIAASFIDLVARIGSIMNALAASEAKYRGLIEQSAEGIILVDSSGTLVEANPILARMTGLPREQALGRKVWDIEFELLPPAARTEAQYERAKAKWLSAAAGPWERDAAAPFETLLRDPGGLSRAIEQVLFPISAPSGRMLGAILRDVTEQRKMTSSLSESLREKELLLQEVHHRVKNNLQIICSLVDLQLNELEEGSSTRGALIDIEARVRSISLVHELLYQSDNFARVDFGSYITQLIGYLSEIYAADPSRIAISVSVDDLSLGLDKAIPCGLLVNEMVANSLKHAFPGGRRGKIEVSLLRSEDVFATLVVSDDGIGAPQELLTGGSGSSVGMGLIRSLVKQLGGDYEAQSVRGVRHRVSFRL
jgi:PAS domain S-box